MANIYSGMTQKQKDNERKYLTNLQNSGNSGEKAWATSQLKQLDSASSSSNSSSSSNRYKTTVTEKDGSTSSGYIEDGRSYYDDGREINAGASVVDSTGKTWTKGGNVGNSTVDMINAAIQKNTYGDLNTERVEKNPYEDAYIKSLQSKYDALNEQIAERNRLAVEQGTNRLNAQKQNINQAAEDNARQAYIMQMQAQKALPQQLASQGATGGTTETANLGLQTTYENNVNSINQNKANAIQEIDNAIVDLKNTGDLSTVEQVLANNQAALDAYMAMFDKGVGYNQWANEYNANRADATYDQNYQERAYADALKQQQFQNALATQEYNLKQQEANNAKLQNAKEETEKKLATNYYNLASSINNLYATNTTGKNSGEKVIEDDGMGGYRINPNISRGAYLDLIIARALDSDMSDEEVNNFLLSLGISASEISRVSSYYLPDEQDK